MGSLSCPVRNTSVRFHLMNSQAEFVCEIPPLWCEVYFPVFGIILVKRKCRDISVSLSLLIQIRSEFVYASRSRADPIFLLAFRALVVPIEIVELQNCRHL